MKRLLIIATTAAIALSTPALAADVGVSISIGQPGFYGQIDIGGFPPPVLLYPQPRVIQAVPVGRPPIYLRVPPGHAKNWKKHCHSYRACGERVYFVRDDWYDREYAPRYRERHDSRREHREVYREERRDDRKDDHYRGKEHDRGNGRGHSRSDERGDERGHDRGRGHDR